MGIITDRQMQAGETGKDRWLIEDGARGAGRFMGRITARGERAFYFRYTTSKGTRDTLPIGIYDAKGRIGMKLNEARSKASELSRLYQSGIRDLRIHFATASAIETASVERERRLTAENNARAEQDLLRRITVRQLFDRWAATELKPHLRADGRRIGRKDGGQYTREQFERRVFPALGDAAAVDIGKADVLAILDAVRAEGKLRTCNVLLADLKQMMRFAVARDVIAHSPLESVTKRQAGGADTERERVLSKDEIVELARALPNAKLSRRSELAIWIILSTGCRIGELITAQWSHVNTTAETWHLPETKNQRPHTIHLSTFARRQFDGLRAVSQSTSWVFPSAAGVRPIGTKALGKQLSDRQRAADKRIENRSKSTGALVLSGGNWTAHDLRRTAATLMAGMGISSDVIDECLNHMIRSRVTRVYIRDRRQIEQAAAFNELGRLLDGLFSRADGIALQGCHYSER